MKTQFYLRIYALLLIVALSFLFLPFRVVGQTNENPTKDLNTPLSTTVPYRGLIGLTTDIVEINNHYFICPGATMAVVINNHYLLGVYANFVVNRTHVETVESILYNVKYEYGGLQFGYISNPIKNLNFGVSSKFGKADIVIENKAGKFGNKKDILMMTPQLDVYYSVRPWFKIALSSGFRMTTDLQLDPIGKHYFNGPNTTIGFLFGENALKGGF